MASQNGKLRLWNRATTSAFASMVGGAAGHLAAAVVRGFARVAAGDAAVADGTIAALTRVSVVADPTLTVVTVGAWCPRFQAPRFHRSSTMYEEYEL